MFPFEHAAPPTILQEQFTIMVFSHVSLYQLLGLAREEEEEEEVAVNEAELEISESACKSTCKRHRNLNAKTRVAGQGNLLI